MRANSTVASGSMGTPGNGNTVEHAAEVLRIAAGHAWASTVKPGLDGLAQLLASLEEVEAALRSLSRELQADPASPGRDRARDVLEQCGERMKNISAVMQSLSAAVGERLTHSAEGLEYRASGSGYRSVPAGAERTSWICEA